MGHSTIKECIKLFTPCSLLSIIQNLVTQQFIELSKPETKYSALLKDLDLPVHNKGPSMQSEHQQLCLTSYRQLRLYGDGDSA